MQGISDFIFLIFSGIIHSSALLGGKMSDEKETLSTTGRIIQLLFERISVHEEFDEQTINKLRVLAEDKQLDNQDKVEKALNS